MAAIAEVKCEDIQSIKDLHDKFGPWKDQTHGGAGDNRKVSCKQTGATYDELMDKYETYYKPHYTEKEVAQAMCKCCQEKAKSHPSFQDLIFDNQWEKYHKCMDTKNVHRHGKKPPKLIL